MASNFFHFYAIAFCSTLALPSIPPAATAAESFQDIKIEWKNDLALSGSYQLNALPPLTSQTCGQFGNCGDGSGFSQGRVDWISTLNLDFAGFGLQTSLEARKDALENNVSYFALYDAFIHGTFETGFTGPLTLRLGRQSVIWGESLYFASNSIAGAQSPIDSSPSALADYNSLRFLPVAQLSFSWQLADDFALVGYRQFEWRHNRVDPYDAFASESDVLSGDDRRVIEVALAQNRILSYRRGSAATPNSDDQYGIGMQWHIDDYDTGLYAIRFDAKSPVIAYYRSDKTFELDYARGVDLIGLSLSGPLFDQTFGGEISFRHQLPLVEGGLLVAGDTDAKGARGDSVQEQISIRSEVPPRPLLPGGANASLEVAANHLLRITDGGSQEVLGRTHSAAALRGLFAPRFFQILPRIDLALPFSLRYNFLGLSPILPDMNRGTGDVTIGLNAILDRRWTLALSDTHYFGKSKIPALALHYNDSRLSDWDHANLSLKVSF